MRIRYAGIHWVDWIIARIDCSLQCQHNELLVVQLMYLLQFANELPQFVFYPKMKERFNNSKGKKNPENFNFSKMRGCQFLVTPFLLHCWYCDVCAKWWLPFRQLTTIFSVFGYNLYFIIHLLRSINTIWQPRIFEKLKFSGFLSPSYY